MSVRALKEAERFISLQKTHDQIEKACDDLIVFDNLVVLAERVTNLVAIVAKYNPIG